MNQEQMAQFDWEEENFQKVNNSNDNFSNSTVGRSMVISPRYHWPNAIVPYQLSSKYSKYARKVIAKAISALERWLISNYS